MMMGRCFVRFGVARVMIGWIGVLVASGELSAVVAREEVMVEYLACDWGPAMALPVRKGEAPRFNDTEEEVYFLKQVHEVRRALVGGDGKRVSSIYLCKMKADGSDKTEIRELWHEVRYPIDTQGQTSWLDVNEKTKRIAVAIGFAGTDLIGLWVMNMDGTGLRRVVSERTEEGRLRAINVCSWTPDGQWIVFEEELRGTRPRNIRRIAKCSVDGQTIICLTNGPWQGQPAVSPDGTKIVYGQVSDAKTGGLYLMDIDGANPRMLPNPDDKRNHKHSGQYPAWSPEGKRILALGISSFVIDVLTGKQLIVRSPQLNGKRGVCGWPQWGRPGIIGFSVGGILFTDSELNESKWLGSSGITDSNGHRVGKGRW